MNVTRTVTKAAGDKVQPPYIGMTHEEAVQRAREFIPVLRERAAQAEAERNIPESTHREFREAGFYRLAQPTAYGGVGLDIDTVNDVCFELSRGDPSASWIAGFYAVHNHTIGTYEKVCQDEYWAEDFDQNMATGSAMIRSEFEDVEGGAIVSGEWDFCSGIDRAEWLQVFRPVEDGAQMVLIPRRDLEIVDNWYTAGARATSSNRVRVEKAFVPSHRLLDMSLVKNARCHGRELYGTRYYKLPVLTFESRTMAYIILGAAQGLLDVFIEGAPHRREIATFEKFIERPYNQAVLAEASAEIDAARELLAADTVRLHHWADTDTEPTVLERARVRRNTTYAVKLATQSANRIYEIAGAHAIYDKSPAQRYFRDVHAMSHSLPVVWAPTAEQYGRVVWGMEPNTTVL